MTPTPLPPAAGVPAGPSGPMPPAGPSMQPTTEPTASAAVPFIPEEEANAQLVPTQARMAGPEPEPVEDESLVTPEEQQAYDDFVTRATMFINDPRPGANGKAPSDIVIAMLRSGEEPPVSIGRVVAMVTEMVESNARQQGVEYPESVLWNGPDELIDQVYDIAVAAQIMQPVPVPESDEEASILGMAKLEAARIYGESMISQGRNDQQKYMDSWHEEMDREAASGALDNFDINIPPDRVAQLLQQVSGQSQPQDMSSFGRARAMGNPSMIDPNAPQPEAPPGPAHPATAPQQPQNPDDFIQGGM